MVNFDGRKGFAVSKGNGGKNRGNTKNICIRVRFPSVGNDVVGNTLISGAVIDDVLGEYRVNFPKSKVLIPKGMSIRID